MQWPPPNSFQSVKNIVEGTILVIDKPLGWTSFDVVNKVKGSLRRHFNVPPFKIGHAGTLDPLATGVLVICTGRFTKSIETIMGGEKEYTGTICLGKTTASYDLETPPEGEFPFLHLTEKQLRENALTFVGEQWQQPPVFSAKKVNGKRAYEAARKGIAVNIPPARISIGEFEITGIWLPEIQFRIRCSKGTYIRSIAHDFGARLNSGSHLSNLRRTLSHPFSVSNSISMEELYSRIGIPAGSKSLQKPY
ncbi:MAG: tRNA pseudouridine(55) synthase TruB [Crocinitomicaceae bacterium]|nr:tRNA pseudouridine(55) synthase TruB [Crocinitomicaceae bacterium]